MTMDMEARVRRLEDRAEISEAVIRYAVSVDRRDWTMFAGCFTDPVYADFSEAGGAAATSPRAELVAGVAAVLDGFTVTQHLSPNHLIEFSDADQDRAVCHSYMYAQHVLEGSPGGEFYLLRGSYTSHTGGLAHRAPHPARRLAGGQHRSGGRGRPANQAVTFCGHPSMAGVLGRLTAHEMP